MLGQIVESIVILFIGIFAGWGLIAIFQVERLIVAKKFFSDYLKQLNDLRNEKLDLQNQIGAVRAEISQLKSSVTGLESEKEAIEFAYRSRPAKLKSNSRVDAESVVVFGRGREWVYLYTFDSHEELARARNETVFPMKLGMSAQENVVDRVTQQVSGSSTAMPSRVKLVLVFQVNSASIIEKWMHDQLEKKGRKVPDSVGVEWFNTNALEVEHLFRSYVLNYSGVEHLQE